MICSFEMTVKHGVAMDIVVRGIIGVSRNKIALQKVIE